MTSCLSLWEGPWDSCSWRSSTLGFQGHGVPPLVTQSSDSVSLDVSRDSHRAVKPLCNLSTEVTRVPWFVQGPFWIGERQLTTGHFTRCQFSQCMLENLSLLSHPISFPPLSKLSCSRTPPPRQSPSEPVTLQVACLFRLSLVHPATPQSLNHPVSLQPLSVCHQFNLKRSQWITALLIEQTISMGINYQVSGCVSSPLATL